jgi:dTDP-4-dehydrorhamnose reductase
MLAAAERPILVAGRSGQLARCLLDQAIARSEPMVLIGRPRLDLEDARNVEEIVDAVNPSAIINAAAYTAVDRAEDELERAFRINRDGAACLAMAAHLREIPFIHISTDYVFDGRKRAPYLEDDVPAPLSVYGRSKLEGETAVRMICPQAVIVRTSWIYSPYGHNFLRTMVGLSATKPAVSVVDDQHGAPTSALDLAAGIMSIVQQLKSGGAGDTGGVHHLTAQGETTWHGFAAEIFAGLSRRGHPVPELQAITTADYPTAARRPEYSCLDSSKAERVFGVRLGPWRESADMCLSVLAKRMELAPC